MGSSCCRWVFTPAMGGISSAMGGVSSAMGGVSSAMGGVSSAMGEVSQLSVGFPRLWAGFPSHGWGFQFHIVSGKRGTPWACPALQPGTLCILSGGHILRSFGGRVLVRSHDTLVVYVDTAWRPFKGCHHCLPHYLPGVRMFCPLNTKHR